ncbi:MAG: ribonuclease VapC [Nitrospirales bacterium]|nr:MAG: ribonuclease VapC [Nitrospirales bacterium]
MTFVDTNVFMYAVGLSHPLKAPSRKFFADCFERDQLLVTSVEVLQELLHAYLPVNRLSTLDAAFTLVESCVHEVWSLEPADVQFARTLISRYAHLTARDLLHVACCKRRDISQVKTFDQKLAAVFSSR